MRRLLREFLRKNWEILPEQGRLLFMIRTYYDKWQEVYSLEINNLAEYTFKFNPPKDKIV